jgi:TonB family protein
MEMRSRSGDRYANQPSAPPGITAVVPIGYTSAGVGITKVVRQKIEILARPDPEYPVEAKERGVEGLVRLRATISQDGAVKNIVVVCGHSTLVPAAVRAVQKWIFGALVIDDRPIEFITDLDLNFSATSSMK